MGFSRTRRERRFAPIDRKTMKALILLALTAFATVLNAQPELPANTRGDLSRLSALAAREPDARKLTLATRGRFPTAHMHGRCMVGFLGRLNGGASPAEDPHVTWGARIGNIISFRIDAHHLDRLNALDCLAYAELALTMTPSLDKAVRAMHADSVQQGINLPQTYTGRTYRHPHLRRVGPKQAERPSACGLWIRHRSPRCRGTDRGTERYRGILGLP